MWVSSSSFHYPPPRQPGRHPGMWTRLAPELQGCTPGGGRGRARAVAQPALYPVRPLRPCQQPPGPASVPGPGPDSPGGLLLPAPCGGPGAASPTRPHRPPGLFSCFRPEGTPERGSPSGPQTSSGSHAPRSVRPPHGPRHRLAPASSPAHQELRFLQAPLHAASSAKPSGHAARPAGSQVPERPHPLSRAQDPRPAPELLRGCGGQRASPVRSARRSHRAPLGPRMAGGSGSGSGSGSERSLRSGRGDRSSQGQRAGGARRCPGGTQNWGCCGVPGPPWAGGKQTAQDPLVLSARLQPSFGAAESPLPAGICVVG